MKCKFAILISFACAQSPLWHLTANAADENAADENDVAPALTLTFIGNEAFMISAGEGGKNGANGEPVLMTDFPYQSGYSVYMTYDPGYLDFVGDIVSLITHRHLDHVDPGLLNMTGWRAIGPRDAIGALDPMATTIISEDSAGPVQYRGISVTPIRTEHSTTEHYSYLVEWRDKSLFFIGDTETADALFQLDREVDVAFLTPWVLRPLLLDKKAIPARQIIVYHHTAIEDTPTCEKCLTPYQGQVIEVR